MEEQDYKNLISVYQQKVFDFLNQVIAFEARDIKSKQTIEALTKRIQELESKSEKPKRTTKQTEDFS